MLLDAEKCECLWRDLALLLFVGERFGELLEESSSFVRISSSSGMMGFFLLSRTSGTLLARYLARLFCQDCAFFIPGPTDDHFQDAGALRDPTILSSASFALPASFPCLDANEEIGLWTTESPDYLTLQLC